MFFQKKNYHSSLIEKLTVSHYKNVEAGVCYGVATAGLQAILLRDTAAFDQRINCLYTIPSLGIPFYITAAQDEWKDIVAGINKKLAPNQKDADYKVKLDNEIQQAWNVLDKRSKILLSVNGFFDTVALHQSPDLYRHLFPKKLQTFNQELLSTATVLTPEALEKQGGIAQIDSFCGAYTVKEIHQLLVSLRAQLTTAKIPFPVGVMLCSYNHAFTIGLDPKNKQWMLIEANNGPTQYMGDYALAIKINSLFSTNKITIFNTRIFTTAENGSVTTPLVQTWKATQAFTGCHKITTERLAYKDSDSATLLYVAAQNGDIQTVRKLIANGADINAATYNTPSPLYIASFCGHTEVVKELLKNGAYVHADYYSGISPLIAAAECRHIDIVKLLLDHGAKLFEIIRDKEVIKLLQEYRKQQPEAPLNAMALTS